VFDQHGQSHFVMVEPDSETHAFGAGEQIVLLRKEGRTFYAGPAETPVIGSQ